MLFQNALIENATTPVSFRVENGSFTAISPDLTPNPGRSEERRVGKEC